ncbi:MAG TPA: proton-conducting transporter membrane subunit [candidate division Zixibacteria bacterium]|nr:proton-conducting transporter membrane subunit [candidate division Zixibacteria bacterium]
MNPAEHFLKISMLYPELALLAVAVILICIELLRINISRVWTGYFVLFGILISGALVVMTSLGSVDAYHFINDSSSRFFKLLFLLAAFLTVTIDMSFSEQESNPGDSRYPLILMSTISLMFLSMASSLVSIFLTLELALIPLVILVTFISRSKELRKNRERLYVIMALSSLFILFGFSFLYGLSGAVGLLMMKLQIAVVHITQRQIGVIILLTIIAVLTGLLIKAGLIPFNSWMKEAHQNLPVSVTAFFSVAIVTGVMAAFAKIFINGLFAFHGPEMNPNDWGRLVGFIAFVNVLFGTIQFLRQNELMPMIHYSNIIQVGFILTGFTAMNELGLKSAGFYLAAFLFAMAGIYGVFGHLKQNLNVTTLEELKGLSKSSLLVASLLATYLMSLAGLPVLAGFVAKYSIIDAALEAAARDKTYHWMYLLAGAGVFSAIIVFFKFSKLSLSMFKKSENAANPLRIPFPLMLTFAITSAGLLFFGIFPDRLLKLAEQIPQAFGFMTE